MPQKFRSFVILAGMRTGSNLLEATLNAVFRVTCFGELFNPYILGWPGKGEVKGITMAERDADPLRLLRAVFEAPNLNGFRYFFDHDPRVFDAFMDDPSCAKIVLTRNPLDSYVSTRLAWETNQWKLNETETPIPAAITFDSDEFGEMLEQTEGFLGRIQHRLQVGGQSAFWLGYHDLRDDGVMTGLLHWLGRGDLKKVAPASDQVPQNPRAMTDKVANFDEMARDLAAMDPFRLHRTPGFEPQRGHAVSTFVAAEIGPGVVFQPIIAGPGARIEAWLEGFSEPLRHRFTPQTLRPWKRAHPGHRSFTVLSHPLHRAWEALRLLADDPKRGSLRSLLAETHRVPFTASGRLEDLPANAQRDLFAAFLGFLRRNLNGQTTLPTHRSWASQHAVINGFSGFSPPDFILREDRLERDLGWLREALGLDRAPQITPAPVLPGFMDDADLRKAAHDAYQRDYMAFGFSR